MAEEVKDFEKQIADEDAQLKAEAERVARETQPPPPEEAKAAEPVPDESKVAQEPPPKEPTPAAKPADEKRPGGEGIAWKRLRERERELEQERAEKQRLKEQLEARDKPTEPDFENQPADYLRLRQEKAEREIAQERQERLRLQQDLQRRDFLDGIKRQEDEYSRTHADYQDAVKYLIDNDIKEWERTGAGALHTRQVLEAARSADPRFQPYRDNIERLANDPGVLTEAEKQGRDPEELAAYVIARDTWISQRRDLIAEGARATGRSVAEIAYEIAKDRGFGGKPTVSPQEQAARDRVAQAKRVAEASNSLSESATAEAAPEVRVLKNRQQVLDLDDDTLDNLIKSGKYRELG